MTIPDLFLLATKAVQGIASLLEGQKRIESQTAAIIQMISRHHKNNNQLRQQLGRAKKELHTLHQLLNKEVDIDPPTPRGRKKKSL